MPGGDRTGPMGHGPRTGRAAGFCSGYGMPGFANPVVGGGRGRGPGFGRGFGGGRGYGRGLGWGRGWAWDEPAAPGAPVPAAPTRDDLARRLDALTAELAAVRRQLGAAGTTAGDDQTGTTPDEERPR